jgi:hypothetical protein
VNVNRQRMGGVRGGLLFLAMHRKNVRGESDSRDRKRFINFTHGEWWTVGREEGKIRGECGKDL